MKDEAEELLKGRVAFFNVWKPFCEKVEELPFAVCDARTSTDEDFLTMKLKYRERTGEIFVLRHSPKHEWYYFPWMESKRAILLKTMTQRPMDVQDLLGIAPSKIQILQPALSYEKVSKFEQWLFSEQTREASRPSHYLNKN